MNTGNYKRLGSVYDLQQDRISDEDLSSSSSGNGIFHSDGEFGFQEFENSVSSSEDDLDHEQPNNTFDKLSDVIKKKFNAE